MGAYDVNTAGVRSAASQLAATAQRLLDFMPLPDLQGAGEFHDLLNAVEDFQADWNRALENTHRKITTLSANTNTAAALYDAGDAERAGLLKNFDELNYRNLGFGASP